MTHIVTTDQGHIAHRYVPLTDKEPLSEEQAQSLADEMDERAKKLGIKTRYEVKPS